jgi:hypothetical protein
LATGNGTEDIVRRYSNPSRLFFFSLHLYDKEQSDGAHSAATATATGAAGGTLKLEPAALAGLAPSTAAAMGFVAGAGTGAVAAAAPAGVLASGVSDAGGGGGGGVRTTTDRPIDENAPLPPALAASADPASAGAGTTTTTSSSTDSSASAMPVVEAFAAATTTTPAAAPVRRAYEFYPGTGAKDDHIHNIINVPLAPLWASQDKEAAVSKQAIKHVTLANTWMHNFCRCLIKLIWVLMVVD